METRYTIDITYGVQDFSYRALGGLLFTNIHEGSLLTNLPEDYILGVF